MTELTPTAESRLNAYLNELRRVLSGSPTLDPTDVEHDIRDHIDAALVGQTTPVDDSALDSVLQTLGSPSQWLSESSRPMQQPILTFADMKATVTAYLRQVARGPESYRLAHLSLLVFAAGWALTLLAERPGPLLVAMPISFIFSRAALSLFTAVELSVSQKWLLYPILVVTYLVLLIVILIAPSVYGISVWNAPLYLSRDGVKWGAVAVALCRWAGANWLSVGVLATLFPAAVRNMFHPFATRFSRRSGLKLSTAGLILLLVAGAAQVFVKH